MTQTPERDPRTTENAAMRAVMEDLHAVNQVDIDANNISDSTIGVLSVPKGVDIVSVKRFFDEYRLNPERRVGTARLTTIESLIDHTNRFKGASSVAFAANDPKNPSVTVVLDYHEEGGDERLGTRHGAHRGFYAFPLSEPWQAWMMAAGLPMTHTEFALFLEDRIGDVLPPLTSADDAADASIHETIKLLGGTVAGPSRLLELSRGLRINENSRVKSAQNISTGEVQVMFETEHTGEDGTQFRIPNMFLIGIPVFENGPLYRIPVRLRYRLAGGKVVWLVQPYRPELTFEHAFTEAVERIVAETSLPVLFGAPEA